MFLGAVIPRSSWTDTVSWASAAQTRGSHSVWSLDDLDPFVQLAALSCCVPEVGLGLVLDRFTSWAPARAAKAIATLDVISGGRVQVAATPSTFTTAVFAGIERWRPAPTQRPLVPWHLANTGQRRIAIVDSAAGAPDAELVVERNSFVF